jgi:site-specific DNA-cytosine methylase
MNNISHATIIPLIGGEAIASTQVFGSRPDYILSYDVFKNNEKHLLNYWNNEVPYYVLDKGGKAPHTVDVISSVCPCAGLSLLSQGYGDANENNQWMIKTAQYVLGEVQPKVFWGENAPGFAGKIGKTVREQIQKIGKDNGYTMSVYRTKSLLHGVAQIRERSFYFFWKGDKTPILHYFNRPYIPIEEVIRNVTTNFQQEPINKKKPSENPYYRYILEVIHGGMTHLEFSTMIGPSSVRDADSFGYIEKMGHNYKQVGEWMQENGYPEEVDKCMYKYKKLEEGGSLMRRGVTVPKDRIGAFVGHYPMMLTHPDEDRFITYREAMTIMGLPSDFELVDANSQNANHICQNVPVQTAADMAGEVLAVLKGERKMVDTDYVVQHNHSQSEEYVAAENNLDQFFS